MLALSITDVRGFMSKLLKEEAFDNFALKSTIIDTFVRFEIYAAAATNNDAVEPPKWRNVRDHVFGVIKGAATPKSIKVVLGGDVDKAGCVNAASALINIQFDDGKISIVTGLSQKSFSLDKSDETRWDDWVKGFLTQHNIGFVNNLQ